MATKRQEIQERQEQQQNASVPSSHQKNSITQQTSTSNGNGQQRAPSRMAKGLGWFSIGLGLAELLAPRSVAKISGLPGKHTSVIRLFGLREIAAGVSIFMQPQSSAPVWSRVAGDGLDIACLAGAFAVPEAKKGRLAFATASVVGVTALDILTAQQLSTNGHHAIHVDRTLVINRSREDLYDFWRDFQNLSKFMKHVKSVEVLDARRSHWVVTAPAGSTVEWDAEITDDQPNSRIAWRSLENADVDNNGFIEFQRAPGDRGTLVRVHIEYQPTGGKLGALFAKLFGEEPGQQINADLRRFKQLMETGEITVSDATVKGTGYMQQVPAQPPEDTAEILDDFELDI